MEYDKLVDLIVEEVCNKVNNGKISGGSVRKVAIVINENNLNEITKVLENDYKISIYGNEDIEGEIVIIPTLSLKAMANLATLVISEAQEEFIIKMLMMGKKVYVLESGLEYRRYKNTASRALYNKYLDFENQLKIHGIQIIGYIGEVKKDDKNLLNYESNDVSGSEVLSSDNTDGLKLELRNKKVISETEIKGNFITGINSLVIDKRSIITPLASDFIRTHNLRVKRV